MNLPSVLLTPLGGAIRVPAAAGGAEVNVLHALGAAESPPPPLSPESSLPPQAASTSVLAAARPIQRAVREV